MCLNYKPKSKLIFINIMVLILEFIIDKKLVFAVHCIIGLSFNFFATIPVNLSIYLIFILSRIILPDTYHLIVYTIKRMISVIEKQILKRI
jgi:hypothetical protein